MTDGRKQHGWEFWAAVVSIALPVLYVASFGPACWIASRSGSGYGKVIAPYHAIVWAMNRHRAVATAFGWYAELGSSQGTWWHLDKSGKLIQGYHTPGPALRRR